MTVAACGEVTAAGDIGGCAEVRGFANCSVGGRSVAPIAVLAGAALGSAASVFGCGELSGDVAVDDALVAGGVGDTELLAADG